MFHKNINAYESVCVEEDHGIFPMKMCKECWRFVQKPAKEKKIAHWFLITLI